MAKRIRVVTFVGTRPEIIKLSRVIAELDRQTDHVLVHTGQNYDYELNEVFFQELEIRPPDHFLGAAGANAAQTISQVIAKADELLESEPADAVLLLGDTNSCLAALPAKRRQIPIFHMEAGNRCFDQRVPEEINRRLVDHLSDVNLPYTEHARRYLLNEGCAPQTVIKTGSPMREVLDHYRPKIEASDVLQRLDLEPGGFFVVSAHREENVDSPDRLLDLVDSLNALVAGYDRPVVFSTHPRTRKRIDQLGESLRADPRIRFLKPLGFPDYIQLQKHAFCVVSDSGTITEESSILGFPAVTIRQAHERPEGMDEGVLIMCGCKRERVLQSVEVVTSPDLPGCGPRPVSDYAPCNVSRKVVRVILSYVDYINHWVWSKPE